MDARLSQNCCCSHNSCKRKELMPARLLTPLRSPTCRSVRLGPKISTTLKCKVASAQMTGNPFQIEVEGDIEEAIRLGAAVAAAGAAESFGFQAPEVMATPSSIKALRKPPASPRRRSRLKSASGLFVSPSGVAAAVAP